MKQETKTKTTTVETTRTIRKNHTGRPPRLYAKAIFTGFRRGLTNQYENQALLKIEGLKDRVSTKYYLGKRVVHIHKAKRGFKTTWGRITSAHGNNGAVKAIFRKNLPARSMGGCLRVMLYPQKAL